MLAELLGEYYDVSVGHSGRQGLSMCLAGQVDGIVTDIGMPDLTGIQMLGEFKKNPALAAIPVIVVTASHFTFYSVTELKRFKQVHGIFSKTEDLSVIVDAVRNMLPAA